MRERERWIQIISSVTSQEMYIFLDCKFQLDPVVKKC